MNKNSILIFDWDDTLFPSTWLSQNKYNIKDTATQSLLVEKLKIYDEILYVMLKKIIIDNTIHPVIITNATLDWIYMSMQFYPLSKSILLNLDILSARDICAKSYPQYKENINQWKIIAFQQYLLQNFSLTNTSCQLISIGDANYEFNALKHVANYNVLKCSNKLFKNVKLIHAPSFQDLHTQIKLLNDSITRIIDADTHLDLHFSK